MTRPRTGKHSPFRVDLPAEQLLPVVFASPHSGSHYPERFMALTPLDLNILRRAEDCFVADLVGSAVEHGAPLISARYGRAYVDMNRAVDEIDADLFDTYADGPVPQQTARLKAGFGVFPSMIAANTPIYRAKLDLRTEWRERIENIYLPYHQELKRLLKKTRKKFGFAILVDCHSMPSLQMLRSLCSPPYRPLFGSLSGGDVDIVLGDCNGESCAPQFTDMVERGFMSLGYRVARNKPYSGGYCTAHYGKPKTGFHAIQLEFNRRLYMDEAKLKPRDRHFRRLKADVSAVIQSFAEFENDGLRQIAAE